MKPHQIALAIAVVSATIFFYQVNNIAKLNEEANVLAARIELHTSIAGNSGAFVRSFFDGLTLGAFAEEGIFTESKKIDRRTEQLQATRASILSRYDSATFFRNASLIVGIIATIATFILNGNKKTA